MKTSYVIGYIVVIIILLGGLIFWMNRPASQQASVIQSQLSPQATTTTFSDVLMPGSTSSTPSKVPKPKAEIVVPTSTAVIPPMPVLQTFIVHGNDFTADLMNISVPQGTPVQITFVVDSQNTYHGGLDFRSSIISTGAIAPGGSRTISFTAHSSFSFVPYWPSTNTAKPYRITIQVQ